MLPNINSRERDTIIAALRAWQLAPRLRQRIRAVVPGSATRAWPSCSQRNSPGSAQATSAPLPGATKLHGAAAGNGSAGAAHRIPRRDSRSDGK